MFTSGGPGTWNRLSRWLRTYRVPVTTAGAFVLVLVVATIVGRLGGGPSDAATPTEEPAATPVRSPCIACGLGQQCDEATGRCVFADPTPVACAQNAEYDEEEGYCVPDPTPRPTPYPSETLAPGATPRMTPAPTPDDDDDGDTTPEPTLAPDATPTPSPGSG
jgi:hypothetical protein